MINLGFFIPWQIFCIIHNHIWHHSTKFMFPLMMISTCKGPILKSFSFIFPFSLMISQNYLLLLKPKKMIRYTKLIKLFKHWHKKVPNIKWLVSFDGRYLLSAYVGIFFLKSQGILSQCENMCMWMRKMKLFVKIFLI